MPPPGPIVTIEPVSYWDKHFGDLMEKAVKRMYILRVCKRNGYSVLITFLTASLCHFLLIVLEFGVLLLIPNTLVKLIGY